MRNEDHQDPSKTSRRLVVAGLLAALALAVLLAALLTRESNVPVGSGQTSTSTSAQAAVTSTSLDHRTEVVDRLRSILRIRDQAFRERNAELLKQVYTVDCPCLEGDRNSIQELRVNKFRVVGGETSIRVERVERVNARLWFVIAHFGSAPLRIEAEGNKVIREEPAGSDLFQFALAKPLDSGDWLLGRATPYQDG
jgi:hypothetical protein